jgi:serine/threonine protein phosphatase PrpC
LQYYKTHFLSAGHGGAGVSKYLQKSAHDSISNCFGDNKELTDEDVAKCLKDGLLNVDAEICKVNSLHQHGSTACAVQINNYGSRGHKHPSIISVNVGDSRAVLGRGGGCIELTADHKPNDPLERGRIEALGGYVKWCGGYKNGKPDERTGVYRVNGNLALSRALGV